MGKIVASYTVTVTLRERDLFEAPPAGGDMWPADPGAAPGIDDVERRVEGSFGDLPLDVNAEATRTDS